MVDHSVIKKTIYEYESVGRWLFWGEADAITDYNDLRMIIEAVLTGTGVRYCRVSHVVLEVPDGPGGGAPPMLGLMGVG